MVDQTLEYILEPDRIKHIAELVVEEHSKLIDKQKIKELERRIANLDRDIDGYIDAIVDMPKSARPKISERIEAANIEKQDLEIELARLRIAVEKHFTTDYIVD